jgi:hypothetical protein
MQSACNQHAIIAPPPDVARASRPLELAPPLRAAAARAAVARAADVKGGGPVTASGSGSGSASASASARVGAGAGAAVGAPVPAPIKLNVAFSPALPSVSAHTPAPAHAYFSAPAHLLPVIPVRVPSYVPVNDLINKTNELCKELLKALDNIKKNWDQELKHSEVPTYTSEEINDNLFKIDDIITDLRINCNDVKNKWLTERDKVQNTSRRYTVKISPKPFRH